MATLAHALQIIGSWIAPLVIFLIRRESRFVAFHALQALLLQIFHVVVLAIFMVGWFILIFSTIFRVGSKPPGTPPIGFFVALPLFWLVLVGANITILVIAIIYAVKAGRGEWADYPVLGRLARKILKMGPSGANVA